jgi:hypothetical protein
LTGNMKGLVVLVWVFVSFLYLSLWIVCILPYYSYFFNSLFGLLQLLLAHFLLAMTASSYYLAITTKYVATRIHCDPATCVLLMQSLVLVLVECLLVGSQVAAHKTSSILP